MRIAIATLLLISTSINAQIVTEEISYTAGETTMKGYLAYDDSIKGERPGVLVVHEWWGHNDYARDRAEQLAGMGYTALALDMYGDGKTASHPKDAGSFAMAVGGNPELAKARFDAAHSTLKAHSSVDDDRTAAIGYCFGGGIVLMMARLGVDIDGVASFHGSLSSPITAEKGKVKAAVRVYNGAADPLVKPEHVTAIQAEMASAGVDFDLVNYEGVVHSFTNPGATAKGEKFELPLAYDEFADKDSWKQMSSFLDEIFR